MKLLRIYGSADQVRQRVASIDAELKTKGSKEFASFNESPIFIFDPPVQFLEQLAQRCPGKVVNNPHLYSLWVTCENIYSDDEEWSLVVVKHDGEMIVDYKINFEAEVLSPDNVPITEDLFDKIKMLYETYPISIERDQVFGGID